MKILLNLDIDFTHFNFDKLEDYWFGSKQFWQALYQEIISIAKAQGVEIIFTIVTNKDKPDFFVMEALEAFKPFFEKNNVNMYLTFNSRQWFLSNIMGKMHYRLLSMPKSKSVRPQILPEAFSNVYCIGPGTNKSIAIKEMANYYQIPLKYCIMFDDKKRVLDEVAQYEIQTLSAECFNEEINGHLLDDEEHIEKNLKLIRTQLINKINELICDMKGCPFIPMLDVSVNELLSRPINDSTSELHIENIFQYAIVEPIIKGDAYALSRQSAAPCIIQSLENNDDAAHHHKITLTSNL